MGKYAEPVSISDEKVLFLDEYMETIRDIDHTAQTIRAMKEKYMRIQGIDYRSAGMPKGKGGWRDMSGFFAKIDRYERILNNSKIRARETRARIQRAIMGLKRTNQRDVLYMRYLQGLSWHLIALEMGISEKKAQDLHNLAVKNLTIPANERAQ